MFVSISKKQVAIAIFIFSLVLVSSNNAYADSCGTGISEGSGTTLDPYKIYTPGELASLNNCLGVENADKHFLLSDNIDLDVSPYNTGSGWTPIGTGTGNSRFFGTLDGNGNYVLNMLINSNAGSYIGLFGSVAGTVKNVYLESVDITLTGNSGDSYVGSIAGYSSGTIMNSTSQGVINATGSYVGGIAGLLDTGSIISKVESRFEISGYNSKVGGIAGENRGGINRSYTLVYITGSGGTNSTQYGGIVGSQVGATSSTTNSYILYSPLLNSFVSGDSKVGGLIGYLQSGTLSDSFSVAQITSSSEGGGAIGKKESLATVSNVFWDTNLSGSTSDGGVGKTSLELKSSSTIMSWDLVSTWWIDADSHYGYPFLQWQELVSLGDVIQYRAESNGTLSGSLLQNLTSRDNPNGTAVTATPNSGYLFSKWSDNSTTNPRSDTFGGGDRLITASFVADSGGSEEQNDQSDNDNNNQQIISVPGTSSSRKESNLRMIYNSEEMRVKNLISQIQQILSLLLKIRGILETR